MAKSADEWAESVMAMERPAIFFAEGLDGNVYCYAIDRMAFDLRINFPKVEIRGPRELTIAERMTGSESPEATTSERKGHDSNHIDVEV